MHTKRVVKAISRLEPCRVAGRCMRERLDKSSDGTPAPSRGAYGTAAHRRRRRPRRRSDGRQRQDWLSTSSKCTAPTGAKVKLQLQWVTQSQFAGYYAAVDKGYYKDAGLDVEIVEGGVDIPPQKTLASGAVDFAISWVPEGARRA